MEGYEDKERQFANEKDGDNLSDWIFGDDFQTLRTNVI